MKTFAYACGCSISQDMYSDEFLDCNLCFEHAKLAQIELNNLAIKIRKIQEDAQR